MRNLLEENYYTSEQVQYMFLSALHHDHKNGNTVLRIIADHKVIATKCEHNLKKLVSSDMPGNVYVSINDFKNEQMVPYCINAMFFDIDGHQFTSKSELETAKRNTMEALGAAVSEGRLGRWSACNDSGRGLQLFYILDRSIMVSARTRRMQNFFQATYRDMTELLAKILERYEGMTLSIDAAVRDIARICRLPKTYNLKENARCKCKAMELNATDSGQIVTYKLGDLAKMAGYDEGKAKKKQKKAGTKKDKSQKGEFCQNFLQRRKEQLETIQTYRDDWNGYRQNFCFIYYNTVAQILPSQDAIKALNAFNEGFGTGIEAEQLRNIVAEVGRHGHYKFSGRYIIDTLGLTRDEVRRSGIAVSSEKMEKREQMREFKAKRDELVVSFICHGHKYEDVTEAVNRILRNEGINRGVSLRTVKNIAKRYNCGHYSGSVKSASEVECYDKSYNHKEKENTKAGVHSVCPESANQDMYKGDVIKTLEQEEKIEKEDGSLLAGTEVKVEGICFDICMEDDEEAEETAYAKAADTILASGKYSYGLSFLTYLRSHMEEAYFLNIIDTFMAELYSQTDERTVHNVMHGVEYLAARYTEDPELHVAVFDLESLTRGMKHHSFVPKVHGLRANVADVLKDHERPIAYEPKKSVTGVLDELEKDIQNAVGSCDGMGEFLEKVSEAVSELKRIAGYKMKWVRIGRTSMKPELFLDMVRNLTVMDLLHITEKVMTREICHGKECGFMFYVREVCKVENSRHNRKELLKIDRLMKKMMPVQEVPAC